MTWSITIERGHNGYVCKHSSELDETLEVFAVMEDYELNDLGELDSTEDMLRYVLDYFGQSGSKHDKRRLKIFIEDYIGEDGDNDKN